MLSQQGGSVKPLLMQVGFDIESLRAELEQLIEKLPVVKTPDSAFLLTPCPFNTFPKVPLSSIIANNTVSLAIN
jgi:hypothetical protein